MGPSTLEASRDAGGTVTALLLFAVAIDALSAVKPRERGLDGRCDNVELLRGRPDWIHSADGVLGSDTAIERGRLREEDSAECANNGLGSVGLLY
jgi:hypothetical protein